MLFKTAAKIHQSFLTSINIENKDIIEAAKFGIKPGDDVFVVLVADRSRPFRTGTAKCAIYSLNGQRLCSSAPMEWGGFYSEFNQKDKFWEFFIKFGTPCEVPNLVMHR